MEEKEVKPTKETKGKLFFEIDWEFIEQMAIRMAKNKNKYDRWGWKNGVDLEEMKQALLRHTIEVMKGNYDDEDMENGHLIACAINSEIISHEIKRTKKLKI